MSARVLSTLTMLCLGGPWAAAAEDYKALLDEAVANVEWNIEESWAFTETSLSEGELYVGRFDPRLEEDARWALLSVDGKEPTDDQRRKYAHDRNEHSDDESDGDYRVVAMVNPDTLELVEETDEHWTFTFVPEQDDPAFRDSVDAKIRIVKNGRYIESLEMRNFQDIRPGFGTRITQLQMRFFFGPAIENGPIVPLSLDVQIRGRALLFIGFDETEVKKYSAFEYAGS